MTQQRHRIRAARELLSPRDKWWIANLYLADSSSDVQRSLIEEYANETIPPDGEIYRKIRHYHLQRNYAFKSRWWAPLRGCRARNLKSFLSHPEIAAGFDALLDVPGLWSGMQLTTLHKMLALRTDGLVLAPSAKYWTTKQKCSRQASESTKIANTDNGLGSSIQRTSVNRIRLHDPQHHDGWAGYSTTLSA
ncbi:hypothetical protein LTR47_011552 [Exophiala xenobiotica]|nr:hypothetical protein LTR92_011244 [Exophiala xenobiotica]KAK5215101.1 hypothetical protein LTR72_011821 [Exophiala xenobiotica]KAK5219311.1 hypothetical protein LTR47_011552 [Exophiala xenobiotica]KAK5283947.1 hypothetical protein LTR14_011787 [Exophiala xenobiotica]KAK5344579.1 hypothetical protein LTR61_011646 [Exophiala xenobiotica]